MNSYDPPESSGQQFDIAIVGMAGRFPGSSTLEDFWRNVRQGVESIRFFSDEELLSAGVDAALLQDPRYVKAASMVEDVDLFDAEFFGLNPREAELTDPQHRVFLECAWEALEHAGYDPSAYPGLIGVYAGASMSSYLFNLMTNREALAAVDDLQLLIGNESDFLTTRVAYKFNLSGPTVNVQTACSTSLVAVHMACQSLLNYQSDMMLAGGVSLHLPQKQGYLYQGEGILSPDGHCRAFDAEARGTVDGNGCGVVVLKRLADAVDDGDQIYAVIKGSAINNDGSQRAGFTAPGLEGQVGVIAEALAVANIDPETMSYIETHGTGTPLGDTIELSALNQVFQSRTARRQFCKIGSLKTNIGHLDAASGVAGLIKTVLALHHREIPPSLNFATPNPQIDFAASPFSVNTALQPWAGGATPRRAGVSSFGLGGTNAHVILEEAPASAPAAAGRPWNLLLVSARSEAALDAATDRLASHLEAHPELALADVAFTAQAGRHPFKHRRMLVARGHAEAAAALAARDPKRLLGAIADDQPPEVTFVFPGAGAHYLAMARDLYAQEAVFRQHLDYCVGRLSTLLGHPVSEVLYPPAGSQAADAAALFEQPQFSQPILFSVEYALAQLWISWGIRPAAMIGYSLGEYVAACLAQVITLDDALLLVTRRAQLMQSLEPGQMLVVSLSEQELTPRLNDQLSLAAVNGPQLCVVAGPSSAIGALASDLALEEIRCRTLKLTHAFHSWMMRPIAAPYLDLLARVQFQDPQIPYISNVTGTWITAAQARDPQYWVDHFCLSVRFYDGLREVLRTPNRVLLEVGPGQSMSSLARQVAAQANTQPAGIVSSLPYADEALEDGQAILNALGQLWLSGLQPDWNGFAAGERRRRVALPTYPFERQRYWIEAQPTGGQPATPRSAPVKCANPSDWFYVPSWERTPPVQALERPDPAGDQGCWLVLGDSAGIGDQLAGRLESLGHRVIRVAPGERFARLSESSYAINPRDKDGYAAIGAALKEVRLTPHTLVHCWSIQSERAESLDPERFDQAQFNGLLSLLFFTQALTTHLTIDALRMIVVTDSVHEISGEERVRLEHTTLLGPCTTIPQEYPNITCRAVDLWLPDPAAPSPQAVDQLLAECLAASADQVVGYRGKHRWAQSFKPFPVEKRQRQPIRAGGVYLITGGLGNLGFRMGEYLAGAGQVRLVLTNRTPLPPREEWEGLLAGAAETDMIAQRIRRVRALEQRGAEVLVLSANVSDEAAMRAVVDTAIARFGTIHGVIHAAGIMDQRLLNRMIHETGVEECRWHFEAKAYGVMVLERVLRGLRLDFCQMVSSLSPILGGLGFTAEASSTLFMDAFARSLAGWSTVSWDGWHVREDELQHHGLGATMAALSMSLDEVMEAFDRILALDNISQIVVSSGDLNARITQWVALRDKQAGARGPDTPARQHYSRPNIRTAYVAPSNDIEQTIVEIWELLLGIKPVGIHDSFFELGGNSLLSVQVLSQLHDAFRVQLSLRAIFEQPTVAEIALLVEDSILNEIVALSEEEVSSLI